MDVTPLIMDGFLMGCPYINMAKPPHVGQRDSGGKSVQGRAANWAQQVVVLECVTCFVLICVKVTRLKLNKCIKT